MLWGSTFAVCGRRAQPWHYWWLGFASPCPRLFTRVSTLFTLFHIFWIFRLAFPTFLFYPIPIIKKEIDFLGTSIGTHLPHISSVISRRSYYFQTPFYFESSPTLPQISNDWFSTKYIVYHNSTCMYLYIFKC